MHTVLVTGVSGAGKSTLAGRLSSLRGDRAVSTDGVDGLCRWVDAAGRRVDRPADPDLRWLAAHRWVWDPTRVDAIIAEARAGGTAVLWLCGAADNTRDIGDRIDLVVMLRVDLDTMLRRLDGSDRGNDFGRAGQTREHLRVHFADWTRALEQHADVIIDAAGEVDAVVEHLQRVANQVDTGQRGRGQQRGTTRTPGR